MKDNGSPSWCCRRLASVAKGVSGLCLDHDHCCVIRWLHWDLCVRRCWPEVGILSKWVYILCWKQFLGLRWLSSITDAAPLEKVFLEKRRKRKNAKSQKLYKNVATGCIGSFFSYHTWIVVRARGLRSFRRTRFVNIVCVLISIQVRWTDRLGGRTSVFSLWKWILVASFGMLGEASSRPTR